MMTEQTTEQKAVDVPPRAKMTVAAALRRIKKLKGEISELTARATSAASYPELRPPPFVYRATVATRHEKISEMVGLQEAVSISNANTRVTYNHKGVRVLSVPRAIRVLDELKSDISFLQTLPIRDRKRDVEQRREQIWDDTLDKTVTRLVEVVTLSVMTPEERALDIEELQAHFEALNVALEARNHDVTIEV